MGRQLGVVLNESANAARRPNLGQGALRRRGAWLRRFPRIRKALVLGGILLCATSTAVLAKPEGTPKGGGNRPTQERMLSVTLNGSGTVKSEQTDIIDCPVVCTAKMPKGTEVTLTAVPNAGQIFSGWSGECIGTGSCVLTLKKKTSRITATFLSMPPPPPQNFPLSVTIEGNGRVESDPPGLACDRDTCVENFVEGTTVILTPRPTLDHAFAGWRGACTGTDLCEIDMTGPHSVTATFVFVEPPPVSLGVTIAGNGQGTVVSTPPGIDCHSGICIHEFPADTEVLLEHMSAPGSVFSGWSGDCTGTGECKVILNAMKSVTGTFAAGVPDLTDAEAKRFLEQATWGPTPALIAYVKEMGKEAYIDEQLALNLSTYPNPDDTPESSSLTPTRNQFFYNAFHRDDQLRQRVAFALGQLFVVSANTVRADYQMVPYLQILHDGAFGNYRDLMMAVTLSPTMGRFLDMVNNDQTEPGSGLNPNENYPRELLQLFSVGTTLLNPDGTDQTDVNGFPIPPYDQEVIVNLSRVMTGWTYPTKPGETPRWRNPSYYVGPMEPIESHHDKGEKILMNGFVISADQTAQEDLTQAIQHIFEHPNVGPFVAMRLIRHLVTSNPSPQYIARVTQVFNANANGVRGDLGAVVKAILLDPEAATLSPSGGHLREPILFEIAFLRALEATVEAENPLYSRARDMGQVLFSPPSVFNYFSPLNRLSNSSLYGPEFQIHSYSNAVARGNFVDRVVRSSLGAGATVDLSALEAIAADPNQLVETVAGLLLHEPLSDSEHQSIVTAISASSTLSTRARNAVYLVAVSSRYQVQH